MSEMLSGADMLVRALQDEGVEYLFGYPGGAALARSHRCAQGHQVPSHKRAQRTLGSRVPAVLTNHLPRNG